MHVTCFVSVRDMGILTIGERKKKNIKDNILFSIDEYIIKLI